MAQPPDEFKPASPSPDPRSWLELLPAPRRSGTANWFHDAVRSGATTPMAVYQHVLANVSRRLWQERDAERAAHLRHALEVLRTEQAGALAYAATVLHYEQLPYEERQRVKAERSVHFLHEAMRGKAVTPTQVACLRRLGYAGQVPQDRAEASLLIDRLTQERGRA